MEQRRDDIKTLARMAARLGGRDPDERITMTLAEIVAFDGPAWRYPDFLTRAEAAYVALTAGRLVLPREMDGGAKGEGDLAPLQRAGKRPAKCESGPAGR